MQIPNRLELRIIDIEIKERNKIKDFFHKLHSRLENIMFEIIQRIPEKLLPNFLMKWLNNYTTKRIAKLKQQITKDRWKEIGLEKAVNEISNWQQNKDKAQIKN